MPSKPGAFAEMLQEWMWSQRPPMNPHRFAARLGVGRQAVYNWLNRGTTPQMQFIPLIHEKTGIPLAQLYAAAGYKAPVDPGVWDFIIEGIERASNLDVPTKDRVLHCISDLRSQYESRS